MRSANFWTNLIRNESGATAIEYGLILCLVTIATITALQGVADENTGLWAFVKGQVEENMGPR
jgi:pilus assembly protein Flp/PilA